MTATTDSSSQKRKYLVGWIAALPDDRLFLEKLGVDIIGPYDDHEKQFNVQMPEDALTRLDPHWGRFYWGLRDEASDR